VLSIRFRRGGVGFILLALLSGHAQAQPAPFCLDGQVPTLEPALMVLNEQIGGLLGDPLECLPAARRRLRAGHHARLPRGGRVGR
jgi:hypothetical protein